MKIRLFVLAAWTAAATWSQTRFDNALTMTFRNGTAVEIHTESTLANSPLSTSGTVAIEDRDVSHRMVINKEKVVFAYDIAVSPVPNNRGAYSVRLQPVDPNRVDARYVTFGPGDQIKITVPSASEFDGAFTIRADGNIALQKIGDVRVAGLSPSALSKMLKSRLKEHLISAEVAVDVTLVRRDYPTIAAVREFPVVRLGEAVNIDILYNPSTGEKIFDVIRPVEPAPARPRRERSTLQDEFSLQEIRVDINGKTINQQRNNWTIGGAAKISLPGYGDVYLAVQPATSHPFQAVGRVDHGKLTFPVGNDFVEITSKSNILKRTEVGTIWVYNDATVKSGGVAVTTAETIEALLPKR